MSPPLHLKSWVSYLSAASLALSLGGGTCCAAVAEEVMPGAAEVRTVPANLGFEDGPVGEAPRGWVFKGQAGATATVNAEAARSGAFGLDFRNVPAEVGPNLAVLGQRIDATPFRGRRVRLSGWALNTSGAADGGHFWMRVDGAHDRMLAINNTPNHPVRAADWTRYDASVPVAEDAQFIAFGFFVDGAAVTRVDDITLTDVGAFNDGNAAARPLSAAGLDNLTAFARLYGYVRYFHPSDEAASADWTLMLRAGVERVEDAHSDRALVDALRALFAPVAPSVRIALQSEPPPQAARMTGDIIAWRHRGLGSESWLARVAGYQSERVAPAADMPALARLDLTHGLVAYVPLIVERAADGHTLPRATAHPLAPNATPADWTPSGDDRTSRLAAVIEAWNIAQHFYPNLETMHIKWAAQLPVSLDEAARDENAAAFDLTLHRLTGAMRDGHAGANRRGPPLFSSAADMPFAWEWIEDHVVITAVADGIETLRPGDVVLAIDGRTIADLLSQAAPPYGGSTLAHWRFNALAMQILIGDADRPETLTTERGGQTSNVAVSPRLRPPDGDLVAQPRPAVIADLEPGLLYVDLTRLRGEELSANLSRMAAARAIVFDVRDYPTSAAFNLLPHLADHHLYSDQFNMPTYTQPDQHGVTYENGAWDLSPQAPQFSGALVFMTDERATSYGESIMGVVQDADLGPIVGAATSGTNGNMNQVPLITGHAMSWTGMQVLRPDGSQRFGVGVEPTLPIRRTIAGVRAGRDEVLEAAIAAARTLSRPTSGNR